MEIYEHGPVAQSLQTLHKGTRFIDSAEQHKVYRQCTAEQGL